MSARRPDLEDADAPSGPGSPPGPGSPSGGTDERVLAVLGLLAGLGMVVANARLSPVLPELRQELGASLSSVGLLISAGSVCSGLFGAVVGWRLRGVRHRPVLVTGCLLICVSTAASAVRVDHSVLLVLRVLQSAGDVLVGVGAPTLLARVSARRRGLFLALWGLCVPVGFALSLALGGLAVDTLGWRSWLWLPALWPAAVCAALLLVSDGPRPRPAGGLDAPAAGPVRLGELGRPLLLGAAFMAVVAADVAILALLPTFLHDRHHLATGAAARLAGLVALASVPGGLISAWLLRRGARPGRVVLGGLAVPVAAWFAFAGPLPGAVAGGAGLVFGMGLMISSLFAAVPATVRGPDHLAVANGILVQAGTVSGVLGVPFAGALVSRHGWTAMAGFVLVSVVAGTLLTVVVTAPHDHDPSPARGL